MKPPHRSRRWLSRELAELFAAPAWCAKEAAEVSELFDVVIVGSGYGGSIAAKELAGWRNEGGERAKICLLERGREYLPGAFPARMADLPGHVRGGVAGLGRGGEGLFDIRGGSDVSVVLANGLGGGSLINAGVMKEPRAGFFQGEAWPWAMRADRATPPESFFGELKRLLGADLGTAEEPRPNHAPSLPKGKLLERMATEDCRFSEAALTIAFGTERVTSGGVRLAPCKLCGDCATGCNYGAKESLDTNLLASAAAAEAEIYCGATVLRVLQLPCDEDAGHAPGEDLPWHVLVTHTDGKLRLREGGPRWIAARRVILAAGSLGSTEILLRSQRERGGPVLSGMLGGQFSTNGDMAAVGYNYTRADGARAIADEDTLPQRDIGPTISGMIEAGTPDQPILLQEMSVAGPIRRIFEEAVTTTDVLHGLQERDCTTHDDGRPPDDPFAVDRRKLGHTVPFAMMGDDGARGALRLDAAGDDWGADGHIRVDWPGAGRLELFERQLAAVDGLAAKVRGDGRTLPNPLWRFLPKRMEQLVEMPRGPLLTVHPLGGCPMGNHAGDGVVNQFGEVFKGDGQAGEVHGGLIILDGSIVPRALGVNPALTISALALRAIRRLRKSWDWHPDTAQASATSPRPAAKPGPRPFVADIEEEIRRRPPAGTRVGVSERLSGELTLELAAGIPERCWVELTLGYAPQRIDSLYAPGAHGTLDKAELSLDRRGAEGRLRVFRLADWQVARTLQGRLRERFEKCRSTTYAVGGTLKILEREATRPWYRVLASGCAWFLNRGLRDVMQGGDPKAALLVPALASHAGEVRTFRYELTVGAALTQPGPKRPALGKGTRILGRKRITYARPGNPWRQLQELTIEAFPGLAWRGRRTLALDPRYFAERNRPLLGIVSQRDHAEALMDIASLAGYFLRLLVSIHFWSARKADPPRARVAQRLPPALPGYEWSWQEHEVDRVGDVPVNIRLTRYRKPGATRCPTLLVHGYSASGTTYAHPSLAPGLAAALAYEGRDVWVVELRSSSGMPMAEYPWTMERVALMDIPAAVDIVCRSTGAKQVDVVAHCMGAVMFSMAVTTAGQHAVEDRVWTPQDRDAVDRQRGARAALPSRIRRAVLSQNGPSMVMTDPNIFRTYAFSFVEDALRPRAYRFRPQEGESLAWALLDRLFATLPYPDRELRLENSPNLLRSLRHLATRHRMDALYGRTFSLANLGRTVLRDLDDFFGPLSLDTLGQVLHFGREQVATNRAGRNRFVDRHSLGRHWTFPTLLVHGAENGMADVATLHRNAALLRAARPRAGRRHIETFVVEGYGHQDCLIGRKAACDVFPTLIRFLDD